MITDSLDKTDLQVIPRWMTYVQSLMANEFGRTSTGGESRNLPATFATELAAFYKDPRPRLAADLFERAFVMGLREETATLAKYVSDQKSLSTTIRLLAGRISTVGPVPQTADLSLAISHHRRALAVNPRNAIRWSELARAYLITRQYRKAERAIQTALGLNSADRYVVRSALRFFIHRGDHDQLLSVGGGNLVTVGDPWLRGVGLSALLIAGKPPRRKLVPDVRNFRPETIYDQSEFLAACGMLEMRYGKTSQARSLFTGAWQDPSGNVTTHAEWATRVHFPGLRYELSSFRQSSPEALAGVASSQQQWPRMYEAVADWQLQEPYSRKPYRFLATVENVRGNCREALESIRTAETMGELDFDLSVSKIYASLCCGSLGDAYALLGTIEIPRTASINRCVLIANWALLALLSGKTEQGVELYARAEREGGWQSAHFKDRVFLNYMVGRRLAGLEIDGLQMARVKEIATKNPDIADVQLLAKRAITVGKTAVAPAQGLLPMPLNVFQDCNPLVVSPHSGISAVSQTVVDNVQGEIR